MAINIGRRGAFTGASRTIISNNLIYDFQNNEHRGVSVWLYKSSDNSQTTISNNLIYSSAFPEDVIRLPESLYTVDNLPPSVLGRVGNISAQPLFENIAAGNYALTAGSPGKNAASDGKDMGADIPFVGVNGASSYSADIAPPADPAGLIVR